MADAKELSLLNNVENRIVFASSDTALQSILNTYLCPILLKLNSPHETVRQKVISICQHVNTRIKSTTLRLPVSALLAQFKSDGNSTLLQNFDLMYVQRGIERIPEEELLPLLPDLIRSISTLSGPHQKTMFHIFLRVISKLPPPPGRGLPDADKYAAMLDIMAQPKDAEYMANRITSLLLLSVSVFSGNPESRPNPLTCPGLGPADFDFLTSGAKETIPAAELANLKVKCLRFLLAARVPDDIVFLPVLVASGADSGSQSLELGESALKKLNIDLDHLVIKRTGENGSESEEENKTITHTMTVLYKLYSGSPPESIAPVKSNLQIKILSIFSKSLLAINPSVFPPDHIRRIVEEGLLKDSKENSAKLHAAVFTYLGQVTRLGSDELLGEIAPGIVETVRSWLLEQCWPRVNTLLSTTLISLRSKAYGVIGLFAKRQPRLVTADQFQLLRFLFSSLRGENVELRMAVEEAISSLLPSLTALQPYERAELRELVLEKLQDDQDGIGWGSYIKAANHGLEFGDLGRIWACLVVAGSGKTNLQIRKDVIDQGEKGLDPYWFKILSPSPYKNKTSRSQRPIAGDSMDIDVIETDFNQYSFPELSSFMKFLVSDGNKQVPPAFLMQTFASTSSSSSHRKYVSEFVGVPEPMLPATISFIRRLILLDAYRFKEGLDSSADWADKIANEQEWEMKLSAMLATSAETRSFVSKYLQEHAEFVNIFCRALMSGLLHPGGPIPGCGQILKEFLPLLSRECVSELAQRAAEKNWEELRNLAWSSQKLDREIGGYAIGLLSAEYSRSGQNINPLIDVLLEKSKQWEDTRASDVGKVYGSLSALPILLSRMNVSTSVNSESLALPKEVVQELTGIFMMLLLESRETNLTEIALEALIEMFQFRVVKRSNIGDKHSQIVEKLKKLGLDGNERAILAIGSLSLVYPVDLSQEEVKELNDLKETLFTLHSSKSPELAFATGEAIAVFSSGWDADVLSRKMDVEDGEVPKGKLSDRIAEESSMLEIVVRDILKMREKSSGVSARKAACVWLLSLVEFCSYLKPVANHLEEIHSAFRAYLNDRDEFVQEAAARGLTVVYEKGDEKLREELVHSLIQSFIGNTRSLAGQVQGDTQLFEPGALPTGDGSVSTYKDIMGLAAEVGDPGLVYKFMSLASHSAMWSSRAAVGRFGLGNLMSKSETLLAANPKLYSALFRYRFDPNPNVRRSMEDIWSALVKDQAATLDEHFDNIIKDLLKTILGKEWRTREASCNAIGDLVQSRPLKKYEMYLQDIWAAAFKVLDDIKASVREAAQKLCRTLTASMIRNVSVETGSSAEDAKIVLKHIMPFLMGPSGLEAQADEVQAFALETLMKLVENAGKAIRPHIADIVEQLLLMMSSLEPQAVNYLHLNAAKYKLTEEKIDAARLSSVRASPLMTTIENCLDKADEATFKVLVPRLVTTLKKLVGLPSKVGASRVLVTLVVRHSFLTRRYANTILQAVSAVLLDINDTVMASYATAVGYLSRLADHEALLQQVQKCSKIFFDHDDDRIRGIAGTTIYAISKHASDNFLSCAADILPFCFVAKHDPNGSGNEFENAWTENTGGTGSVKLYLPEIVSIVKPHLSSPRWTVKQTCQLALAAACTAIGIDLSESQCIQLWPVVLESLSGKTWEGKEKVFDAFVTLTINAPKQFMQSDDHLKEAEKVIIRESSRRNPKYRAHALGSLAKFTKSFDQIDVFDTVFSLVKEVLEDEDEDEGDAQKDSKMWRIAQVNAVTALACSYRQERNEKEAVSRINRIFAFIEKLAADDRCNHHTCKLAIIRGVDVLLDRMKSDDAKLTSQHDIEKLLGSFTSDRNEEVRTTAAEVLSKLSSSL